MVARRRYIDPSTGDYVKVNGAPREDITPASKVVLRLRTRRGSIPGLPNFGSRFHEIRTIGPTTNVQAQGYAEDALSDLVQAGEIRDLSAVATATGGALAVTISYRDTGGRRQVVPYTHKVV